GRSGDIDAVLAVRRNGDFLLLDRLRAVRNSRLDERVGTGLDAEEAGVAVVGVRVVAVADRPTDGLALAQLEARAADRLPGFVLQGDDKGARSGIFGRLGRRLGGRLFRGRLGRFLGCGWFGRRLFGGGRLLDDRLGAADLDFGDAVGR